MVISSHAGDAPGERITYQCPDAEGRQRRLVVDQALGIDHDRSNDRFNVMHYHRFHSLDGVDWSDTAGKAALPVGSAITSWSAAGGPIDRGEFIVERQPLDRVIGSMAIQLHDGIWLFASHGFAPESAPIFLNNSCWSWHELSQRTTFAGARGYIGTLFPVVGAEAQAVGTALFGVHIGKDLCRALWLTQQSVYNSSERWPYVMVGLPFVSIRPNKIDSVAFTTQAYMDGIAHWTAKESSSREEDVRQNARRFSRFLFEDLQAFRANLRPGRRSVL